MTNQDPSADLSELLRALGEEEEPTETERSPFAIKLAESIDQALRTMCAEGAIEIDEGSLETVIVEVTESGLDARSPKHLVKRVVRTLMESDHVDEVYGTDDELGAILTRSLEGG